LNKQIGKQLEFSKTSEPADHVCRSKEMLKAHPEIAELYGYNRWSYVCLVAVVGLQLSIGYTLNESSIWTVAGVSYFLGSLISLSIMILVHDASHNLIAKSKAANNAALFVANLGILWPASLAYRRYHLNHHKNFGFGEGDVDMPTEKEAKMVGNSKFRKLVWLVLFPYVYVIARSANDKTVKPKPLFVISLAVQAVVLYLMLHYQLDKMAIYLALSPIFCMTLSPAMGSRGLIEHFVFRDGQETYSYYGPYNKIMFNGGYHTEHHDFCTISWDKIPQVRKIAPEFYRDRYTHGSYFSIIKRFVMDDSLSLYNRILREKSVVSEEEPTPETMRKSS
jgi:sphingolipid 4-desaturase/C4-monooxygenase